LFIDDTFTVYFDLRAKATFGVATWNPNHYCGLLATMTAGVKTKVVVL
jgi:hypothetical protein